jgi:protein-tyrosine phosphatase
VIDLHCHILPGLDDGVRTLAEAREVARHALEDGVRVIAATPHVRADYPTTPQEMERGVTELRRDLAESGLEIAIASGGEVAFGYLPQLSREALSRFTLNRNDAHLLIEFPYHGWPLAIERVVMDLRAGGLTPILAHPERNPDVQERPARLAEVIEAGALVQITALSVLGRLGRGPKKAADALLAEGLVHVLATDGHGPHIREGGLAKAARALRDEGLAHYLTSEAPSAILAGEAPPMPRRLIRRRLFAR